MKAAFRSLCFAALVATAACTVHGTDVPELTGPSDFALSLSPTATPDSISQDGASQSSIAVVARGPDGNPKSGVVMRLQTAYNGTVQDYGTLSAKSIVSGADGRATAIYTAPPPPPSLGGSGAIVTIIVTPVGTNYQTANSSTAEIRLVPPGVVMPPASAPTAKFTVSPTPVAAAVPVNFDASTSCATQSACSSTTGITAFAWAFGDGTSSVGQTTSHAFAVGGTYTVTLTVTNDRGLTASSTQSVTVTTSADPTAVIDVSPGDTISVAAGTVVSLSGERSKAANGRTLTQFNWNLGTGSVISPDGVTPLPGGQFPSGLRPTFRYTAPGKWTVILSVLDDAGQKATATTVITVLP